MSVLLAALPSAGTLTAVAALLAFIISIWRKMGEVKGSKAPPSLPRLPLVGSLPFMTSLDNLPMFLLEKTKKYGHVYTLDAAGKYTLVVNGYDALREALVKRAVEFAGRTQFYTDRTILNKKCLGIIMRDYDETLKQNRHHSLNIMKQLGFGDRHIMADRIQTELDKMTAIMRSKNGKPMEVARLCHWTTVNIIHSLVLGKSYAMDDPMSDFLMNTMIQLVDSYDPLLDMFPLCAYLPSYRKMLGELVGPTDRLLQYYSQAIRECIATPDEEGTNFSQMYQQTTGTSYDEDELKFILRDLVMAGAETTGVQLGWAILYLCNNPDIQRKLYDELLSVVGRDRPPCLEDRVRMPYMEATILELMRIRPVAPLAGAHKTLCPTQLCGYDIPAYTTVIVNLWSAHMDPSVWQEPEKFRPERFLNSNGEIINQDKMITFSLGKRSCLGEVLARQEVFLALTTFVQNFNILPPDGVDKLSEDMKVVRVIRPMPFEVRMVPRV